MAENEDKSSCGIGTIIALVLVVIAIPYYFLATVLNPKLDAGTRISHLLLSLPSIFLILCFLIVAGTAAVLAIPVYLDSDAWPIGVYMILIAVIFIGNLIKNFTKKE